MPDFGFLPDPLDASLDWDQLCEASYEVYRAQVRDGGLMLNGIEVRTALKLVDGKETGFWHVVTRDPEREKGKPQGPRAPDHGRAARVPWIPALIKNSEAEGVSKFTHLGKSGFLRHYVWAKEKSYVVVLEESKVLYLVTAFIVDTDHMRYQLAKRKLEFERAQAPPK